MGWLMWVFALGVVVACYYGYRRLQALEREIRREIAGEGHGETPEGGEAQSRVKAEAQPSAVPAPPSAEGALALKEQVLKRVQERPEMLQTELYALFPKENRRALQELLKKMDREGALLRTREGGTYRLHPGRG